MRSGSACKVISLPCPNVADRQFTRCGPFSMRSSTCCAPAAHGAISPPTFHRGRPSSPISGVCASKGPGRSCYGRCTALDANDKEGILTQLPKAGIRHPRENGRGVVWDLWLRCPHTHQRAETAHPRGYAGHPHLYLRDPCRYTRYPREFVVCEHRLTFFVPRLCKDLGRCGKRAGRRRAQWCQATGERELEGVERPSGTRGFSVVPAPDGSWSEHSVGFLANRENE
jgi:hypothetical protein